MFVIGFVKRNGNRRILPYSNTFKKVHKPVEIIILSILVDKHIKEIRIISKLGAIISYNTNAFLGQKFEHLPQAIHLS